jgi:Type I restriction enzyme R protein N terminus (HSDR_N)
MKSLTEDEIEQYQLQLLQNLGYVYTNGYDIQLEGRNQERESFGDVVLVGRLTKAIDTLHSRRCQTPSSAGNHQHRQPRPTQQQRNLRSLPHRRHHR